MTTSVANVLDWLTRHSSAAARDGMARYGIPSDNASGVSVADLRGLAKQIGPDHQLALALWETGSYEARMLTPFIDEPARVTPAQMDRALRRSMGTTRAAAKTHIARWSARAT